MMAHGLPLGLTVYAHAVYMVRFEHIVRTPHVQISGVALVGQGRDLLLQGRDLLVEGRVTGTLRWEPCWYSGLLQHVLELAGSGR